MSEGRFSRKGLGAQAPPGQNAVRQERGHTALAVSPQVSLLLGTSTREATVNTDGDADTAAFFRSAQRSWEGWGPLLSATPAPEHQSTRGSLTAGSHGPGLGPLPARAPRACLAASRWPWAAWSAWASRTMATSPEDGSARANILSSNLGNVGQWASETQPRLLSTV